ncbi:MAG TPA: helix-turn-helix domain-containing protein, partial [Bacillus sp. (in: firmicutes)]
FHVWGYEYEGETNVIDVYIRHLRKKIEEDFSSEPIIHTVRGVGYTIREN